VSVTRALPATPCTPVGASGRPIGVTADDAVDAALEPFLFVARTVNV
jgi:hypothetical protein